MKYFKLLYFFSLFCSVELSHAEDLLDPSNIGSVQRSISAGNLLDPTQIDSRQITSSKAILKNPLKASDGREMAVSVMLSLKGLMSSAIELLRQIDELKQRESELSSRLHQLEFDKKFKLKEYREGLFCSGCGQTKSEILAKGENFPHPGQRIIQPTLEQIANKERQLQAPIDQAERDLKKLQNDIVTKIKEKNEALDQIPDGVDLWRTSITYENNILRADEKAKVKIYKDEFNSAQSQIDHLKNELIKEISVKEKIQKEMIMWSNIQNTLDNKRSLENRKFKDDIQRAFKHAMQESEILNKFLSQQPLSTNVNIYVQPSYKDVWDDFIYLGGLYRMGDYSPDRHGQSLPKVKKFIDDFRSTNTINIRK